MKVATYNVASVRARMPRLLEWLDEASPDLVALQETKVEDHLFPREEIESRGYCLALHGQKAYNGVALLSRCPLEAVEVGFLPGWPTDCRVITAQAEGVLFINTYVPNGTAVGGDKWAYKLSWLDAFNGFLAGKLDQSERVVWLGDINIAPTPDDVFEPTKHLGDVGHHPDEFSRLATILGEAWQDAYRTHHVGPGHYTFWDFRLPKSFERNLGWRIDHIYLSPALHGKCTSIQVERLTRGRERPSDHAPLLADLAV